LSSGVLVDRGAGTSGSSDAPAAQRDSPKPPAAPPAKATTTASASAVVTSPERPLDHGSGGVNGSGPGSEASGACSVGLVALGPRSSLVAPVVRGSPAAVADQEPPVVPPAPGRAAGWTTGSTAVVAASRSTRPSGDCSGRSILSTSSSGSRPAGSLTISPRITGVSGPPALGTGTSSLTTAATVVSGSPPS
jgi:hypothetical protein